MRILTALAFSALLSAPAFGADLGMYRPGTPYGSSVAPGADVCESYCAGDAQCRGWNYVKPNPRVSGVCEYLSSVSTPIPSQISISGEGFGSNSFSSRVTSGATNTVRVGTQVSSRSNTVTVGQPTPQSNRRIVREAPPQRATPQSASANLDPMSLTAQQNRFRQQTAPQPTQSVQPTQLGQPRQMLRPILDGPVQYAPQSRPLARPQTHPQTAPQMRPQINPQSSYAPQPRRATGPRRLAPQQQAAIPQQSRQPSISRPPIGQPIPAPQNMARRSVIAPQSAPAREVSNPVALAPEQAKRSLYGRLNDDVRPVPSNPNMPIATAVPSIPVQTQPMEALAGGR